MGFLVLKVVHDDGEQGHILGGGQRQAPEWQETVPKAEAERKKEKKTHTGSMLVKGRGSGSDSTKKKIKIKRGAL